MRMNAQKSFFEWWLVAMGGFGLFACSPNIIVPSPSGAPSGNTVEATPTTVPSEVILYPTEDTFLNVDTNVEYSHSSTSLNLYTWPEYQMANTIIIKVDLSAFPAGTVISGAILSLYQFAADLPTSQCATHDMDANSYSVAVQKIINVNPDVTQATGFKYDGIHDWTASPCCGGVPLAQGDLDPTIYDVQILDKTNGYKTWDITALVQSWIDAPATNFGLAMSSDVTKYKNCFRYFSSSREPDAGKHPFISIQTDL